MEGSVFLVPLRNGQDAACVVTRHARAGATVGHFFPPSSSAQMVELAPGLVPSQAILVARFGDFPIVNDVWHFVGNLPGWQRDQWPSTKFFRGDHKAGYTVVYDDRDPSEVIAEYKAGAEDLALPKNDFYGDLALQTLLSEILRDLNP
ncbi:Imm26 family immunity protein [Hamadaea flava]|uniref:Imm26 family immunity protein n=1 Tax=Hamadaea flava TaxID=1742688 RepID=A0ABV8LZA6_9ACTN|nr:Imm26 family immunity protein [Hamadaea flava]